MTSVILDIVIFGLSFGIASSELNDSYLINTNRCSIPNLAPFFPKWPSFVPSVPEQCSEFEPLLTYVTVDQDDVATLHVRQDEIAKRWGNRNNVSCCYSYILRRVSELDQDAAIVAGYCYRFVKSVQLMYDTVWVSCGYSMNNLYVMKGFPLYPLYANVHQVIRKKTHLARKNELLKASSNKRPISVLLVIIDSVSRLNFIRTMPKTRDFITSNGFYEFSGYNKVDDNTFPNAMALLTGMNLKSSFKVCQPTTLDGLDNCPFIWKDYANLGYTTAYVEDWAQIATFNYLKKGFKHPPTDYYFKPYMDIIQNLAVKYQDTMPFCAGPESQGDRILNLAYDFATTFKSWPNFGVFWTNTFSHNVITTPKTMDDKVRTFFENLEASGVMDESVVVLLSDHGIRFGPIMNTSRGYYEVRLPMNYISLPPWFKERYPRETKHFQENTNSLLSTYDMYMTLQHILVLSGTNHTILPSLACPNCRSLFEKMPLERSCADAGIPDTWCSCNLSLDLTED